MIQNCGGLRFVGLKYRPRLNHAPAPGAANALIATSYPDEYDRASGPAGHYPQRSLTGERTKNK